MKRILLAILALFIIGSCYAAETEEIELTTYYPAPYGDYVEISAYALKLNPTNPLNEPVYSMLKTDGMLISDSTDSNKIKQWDSSLNSGLGGWTDIRAGAGSTKTLYGIVNMDGSMASGNGFTSSIDAINIYTITFSTPFSSMPAVTITPYSDIVLPAGSDTAPKVEIHSISMNNVVYHVENTVAGGQNKYKVSFIAVGK